MARSDMFFKATGQRSGAILGEANDKTFVNQIDIVDWSWGMTAPSTVAGQRTGRVQLGELRIVKRADKASTALMSVLNNNETMPTAVLTVRKSGGDNQSLPYFIVTLSDARINSYNVNSTIGEDGAPLLLEHLGLTFKSITIDYTPQTATGGAAGASSFTGIAGPT
jgi:type VI secretion system secreted protein Hcp